MFQQGWCVVGRAVDMWEQDIRGTRGGKRAAIRGNRPGKGRQGERESIRISSLLAAGVPTITRLSSTREAGKGDYQCRWGSRS